LLDAELSLGPAQLLEQSMPPVKVASDLRAMVPGD
jgi:hypothetical protein